MQDFSRTVDYLETREDIVTENLGYYGSSWGSMNAPIPLVVEKRIKAAVLHVGGLPNVRFLPEVDPFNFVAHVRMPILMVNGEFDPIFPLETHQKPMFELLGTPSEHKRHYYTPAAHRVPRNVRIREVLNWFDKYLGPVK